MVGILTSNPAKCGNCRKPVVGPPRFDRLAHRLAVALDGLLARGFWTAKTDDDEDARTKADAVLDEARKAGALP